MALPNSIVDKVNFLLALAKKGEYGEDELKTVLSMTGEHTDNKILGRVFGYSVSDYALAALKWLGTDETAKAFQSIYDKLDVVRREEINQLISEKPYLEY